MRPSQGNAGFFLVGLVGLVALALLMCAGAAARADTESAPATGARTGRRGNSRHAHASRGDKIAGHCTLLTGPDNPIAGPCANTVVILSDAKGDDVDDTRTTSGGDFEFNGLKGRPSPFRIRSGSRFYEVVSPTGPFPAGAQLDLKLRQK